MQSFHFCLRSSSDLALLITFCSFRIEKNVLVREAPSELNWTVMLQLVVVVSSFFCSATYSCFLLLRSGLKSVAGKNWGKKEEGVVEI